MKTWKIVALFIAGHVILPPLAVIYTLWCTIKEAFRAGWQEMKHVWGNCWRDVRGHQKEGWKSYYNRLKGRKQDI